MYLWVILTTFLAMIAAYYLPVRADTEEKLTVPVAQAQLIQMVAKQKAAMQYMVEHSYPYYCAPGFDCATNSNARRIVNFTSGSIAAAFADGSMATYMPKGFINNPNYTTRLYCMKLNHSNNTYSNSSDCNRNADDETTTTERALVTYGPIPERWQTLVTEGETTYVRPSPDLMNAMRQQFTKQEIAGYVYDDGNNLIIVNFEYTTFVVPSPMRTDGNGLKSCVDNPNNHGTCLVYLSWR